MTISLYIFLFLYFIFLFVWVCFSVVSLYHIFKYGFGSLITFLAVFIFIFISALILFISFNFINEIEWGINFLILEPF
jgi:hypothetical protein